MYILFCQPVVFFNFYEVFVHTQLVKKNRGRRGRDRMVVGCTTTYATSAYHL